MELKLRSLRRAYCWSLGLVSPSLRKTPGTQDSVLRRHYPADVFTVEHDAAEANCKLGSAAAAASRAMLSGAIS